jgi:hypothetical protein
MAIFLSLQEKDVIEMIRQASRAVLYAAPGLSTGVAQALVDASKRIGQDRVWVFVDPGAHVTRMGYAPYEGIEALFQAEVQTYAAKGLRAGFLRTDDFALAFTPVSEMLEQVSEEITNAVQVSPQEALRITEALIPKAVNTFNPEVQSTENKRSEVSDRRVSEFEIKSAKTDLRRNPPVAPDLARKMNVLNSRFQFVEITFKGSKLGQRKLSLKASDLGVSQKDFGNNLSGTWKVIGSEIKETTKELEQKLKEIYEDYLHLLPKFGWVVMAERMPDFEKAMESFKKEVENAKTAFEVAVGGELQKSRDRLNSLLIENYRKNPPQDLQKVSLFSEPDIKQIENKVDQVLKRKFPTADVLLKKMSIDWKIYNISEQIMRKKGFSEAIQKVFYVDLEELVKTEGAVAVKPVGQEV